MAATLPSTGTVPEGNWYSVASLVSMMAANGYLLAVGVGPSLALAASAMNFCTDSLAAFTWRRIMPMRARNSTILPVAFKVWTAFCMFGIKAQKVGKPRGQVISTLAFRCWI